MEYNVNSLCRYRAKIVEFRCFSVFVVHWFFFSFRKHSRILPTGNRAILRDAHKIMLSADGVEAPEWFPRFKHSRHSESSGSKKLTCTGVGISDNLASFRYFMDHASQTTIGLCAYVALTDGNSNRRCREAAVARCQETTRTIPIIRFRTWRTRTVCIQASSRQTCSLASEKHIFRYN